MTVHASLAAGPTTAPARRRIVLQTYSGTVWQAADDAVTDSTGRASWRYSLGPGVYRIRARFAGATDARAAVSWTIVVRVT